MAAHEKTWDGVSLENKTNGTDSLWSKFLNEKVTCRVALVNKYRLQVNNKYN